MLVSDVYRGVLVLLNLKLVGSCLSGGVVISTGAAL